MSKIAGQGDRIHRKESHFILKFCDATSFVQIVTRDDIIRMLYSSATDSFFHFGVVQLELKYDTFL